MSAGYVPPRPTVRVVIELRPWQECELPDILDGLDSIGIADATVERFELFQGCEQWHPIPEPDRG